MFSSTHDCTIQVAFVVDPVATRLLVALKLPFFVDLKARWVRSIFNLVFCWFAVKIFLLLARWLTIKHTFISLVWGLLLLSGDRWYNQLDKAFSQTPKSSCETFERAFGLSD